MRKIYLFILCLMAICSCSSEKSNDGFEYNYPQDCCAITNYSGQNVTPQDSLFIATSFVPNSSESGSNRIFFAQTANSISSIDKLSIKSQEGNVVFENSNFKPNDPTHGWDGSINGEYVEGPYMMTYNFQNANGENAEIEAVVCLLTCSDQGDIIFKYRAQGMDFDDCRWVSQHDGQGGFDGTLRGLECF